MTSTAETLLARVTGVPKSTLANTRKRYLAKGPMWVVVDAQVHYTEAGLKKLLSILGIAPDSLAWPQAGQIPPQTSDDLDGVEIPPDEEDEAPEAPDGQPEAGAPPISEEKSSMPTAIVAAVRERTAVEVKVVRIPRNPTLLLALCEGAEVRVKVRSNVNFVIGMKFNVRPPAEGGDVWFFEGRLPRYKGKF